MVAGLTPSALYWRFLVARRVFHRSGPGRWCSPRRRFTCWWGPTQTRRVKVAVAVVEARQSLFELMACNGAVARRLGLFQRVVHCARTISLRSAICGSYQPYCPPRRTRLPALGGGGGGGGAAAARAAVATRAAATATPTAAATRRPRHRRPARRRHVVGRKVEIAVGHDQRPQRVVGVAPGRGLAEAAEAHRVVKVHQLGARREDGGERHRRKPRVAAEPAARLLAARHLEAVRVHPVGRVGLRQRVAAVPLDEAGLPLADVVGVGVAVAAVELVGAQLRVHVAGDGVRERRRAGREGAHALKPRRRRRRRRHAGRRRRRRKRRRRRHGRARREGRVLPRAERTARFQWVLLDDETHALLVGERHARGKPVGAGGVLHESALEARVHRERRRRKRRRRRRRHPRRRRRRVKGRGLGVGVGQKRGGTIGGDATTSALLRTSAQ